MKQLVEIENTKRRAIILAALTEYVPFLAYGTRSRKSWL